jgi:hypothetical protein
MHKLRKRNLFPFIQEHRYQAQLTFFSETSKRNSFSQTKNQEIHKNKKRTNFERTKIKATSTQKTKREGETCYLSLARF